MMRGRGGAAWLGWYHVTSGFHLVFIGGQPDCTGSPLVSTVHTMRLFLSLLLLSLSCLPAQPGPSHGRRHSRRYRARGGGRGARGWGGGVGGNKIAVGTQCRLVKQTGGGGGGGGGKCFQEEECGQVCSSVSQTQCSTVSVSQCNTVSVPQCRSHLSLTL